MDDRTAPAPTDDDLRVAAALDHAASLVAWTARRAVCSSPTLRPVAAIGLRDGRVVAVLPEVDGVPLPEALARIGDLTPGVAVTLSMPLVAVVADCLDARGGLGAVRTEDVLVDMSGATVVCDRPPPSSEVADGPGGGAPAAYGPDGGGPAGGGPAGGGSAGRGSAGGGSGAGGRTPVDEAREQGLRGVLLAVRAVWDRVDPGSAERAAVDAALDDALRALRSREGRGAIVAVARVAEAVQRAAAPRPLRWDQVPVRPVAAAPSSRLGGAGGGGAAPWSSGLLGLVADVAERGVPLGGERRLPVRRAIVGLLVAGAALFATVFALDGETARRSAADTAGGATVTSGTVAGEIATGTPTATVASTAAGTTATGAPGAPDVDPGRAAASDAAGSGRAQAATSRATPDPVRAALELFDRRAACATRTEPASCLRATTAPNSVMRERDDLAAVDPGPNLQNSTTIATPTPTRSPLPTPERTASPWRTGTLVDTAAGRTGDLALVRLTSADGTRSASVLLERAEADAGWLIRSLVDSDADQ